ncbi:MAG TPA: hypothetical protein VMM12_00265, partial [Longimicrobiales bacterium]|nr:hypothetical protein [Longimicrobiales bacterium]
MRARHALPASLVVALVVSIPGVPPGPAPVAAQEPATVELPSPQQHFGYPMGAEGRLADWAELAAYYRLLAAASPRVEVVDMGPSTLGKPFLALFVS